MSAVDRAREVGSDGYYGLKNLWYDYKQATARTKVIVSALIVRVLLFIAGVIFLINGLGWAFLTCSALGAILFIGTYFYMRKTSKN